MLALRLPEDIEKRLELLARKTGRSKSYYAKRAIEEFLEDQEDYLIALGALERVERGERTISLEALEKQLGLERPVR